MNAPNRAPTMRSNIYFLIFFLLAFPFASDVAAASFDCAKAKGSIETLVCQNPGLSKLDDQLATTYKAALAAVAPSSRQALLKEERNWASYARDICQDAACLEQAYSARIEVLARNEKYIVDTTSCDIPDGSSCRSVVFSRDPNSRIESFNQSLSEQKRSGKIIGCRKLIDLPVGTANGNDSFGGYCVLEDQARRTDVRICNDEMVGHFAIEPADLRTESDKALIDFTNDQCFGG